MNNLGQIENKLKKHNFIIPKLFESHYIQSVGGHFVPHFTIKNWQTERKYITTLDGTKFAVDIASQPEKEKHPTIVVLDGFGGSSSSAFSLGMGRKAFHFGFNVLLFNQRGQGDTLHMTKSLCDSGLEGDLEYAITFFRKWGFDNFYLAGLSYGGFLSLLTVCKLGKKANTTINGLALISAAVDIPHSWQPIEKSAFYRWAIVGGMRNIVRKKAKIDLYSTWNLSVLKNVKTIRQWDSTFMHTWGYPEKFSSVDEYYELVNPLPFVPTIDVPTLAIHAYDDPILPVEPFTKNEFQNNPHIITFLTRHGGHGRFVTTKKSYEDLDRHWAENRAIEFFRLLEGK